jgi:ABC-type transporter Mla maintaining outer membrane lipid asymmetry ATPase subunit MlaF
MSESLLDMRGVVKEYQGLRPLRIRELSVVPSTVMSIAGIDALAAEVFVHLVTGATLPQEGTVTLFGQDTRAIADSNAWLTSLDGVGMITPRGVLIEAFSVLQNIAMSYTLDVDPIDSHVVPQAGALAREVGIAQELFDLPVGKTGPEVKMRVHLARALALGPKLLIGADLVRVARSRGLALVVITADDTLARAIGGQRLELVPATGELRSPSLLKKIFG